MSKRKKIIKMRGSKTCAHGPKKKHRGRGSQGGGGLAGSKTHRQFMIMKTMPGHIGKYGFHGLKGRNIERDTKAINVKDLPALAENGEVDLDAKGYDKVLGGGWLDAKLTVKARSFTPKAEEKISKAGGKAVKTGQ